MLSIDHNAGLISEEDLLSDISFVIVRRLIDELEQTPVAEQAGIAQYRMTLTVKKGGGKQNED